MAQEKKDKIPSPPPYVGHDFPVFDAPNEIVIRLRLSSLLKEKPIVSVDEAARLTKLTAEAIKDYVRHHPKHLLWLEGETPSITYTVAPDEEGFYVR